MNQLNQSTGLLIDIDDTLIATHSNAFNKSLEVARLLGVTPPSREEFYSVYNRLPFEECIQRLHPGVALDDYKACYDSMQADFPDRLLTDLHLIEEMRKRVACMGILTNGPGKKTDRKLNALGINAKTRERLFACIFHSDNLRFRKPDPRCFDSAKEILLKSAEGITYIGDSLTDWRAARDAKISFIGVLTGTDTKDDFLREGASSDMIIPSVNSLIESDDSSSTP